MYHILYKTVRPETGEYYYGIHSTQNLQDGYQGSGVKIRKLKEQDAFLITGIVEQFYTRASALMFERVVVNEDTILDPLCLNQTIGGGGMPHIPKFTDEARAKMSRSAKRRPTVTEETRQKMRAHRLGKKYTLEERLSRVKGLYVTPAGTFTNAQDPAALLGVSYTTIKRWCNSDNAKYSGYAYFRK